jgi:hypothetical protein
MLTKEELAIKLAPVPSIWLTLEERMCLLKYAGLSKAPIVEIGTAFGGSACILVLGSNVHVHSVDPFQEPLCQVDGYNITADGTRAIVQEVLGNQYARWELWVRPSDYVANHFAQMNDYYRNHYSENAIDLGLVFIDGNHDYAFVHQDVTLCLPLIQRHGFLILHDSRRDPRQAEDSNLGGYPGPTQVAQELTGDKRVKLIETAYSMTVWEVQ